MLYVISPVSNITIYTINAALNYFDHNFVNRIMLSIEVCMQSSHSFVPAFSLVYISYSALKSFRLLRRT